MSHRRNYNYYIIIYRGGLFTYHIRAGNERIMLLKLLKRTYHNNYIIQVRVRVKSLDESLG